jgi:hypothetical protein
MALLPAHQSRSSSASLLKDVYRPNMPFKTLGNMQPCVVALLEWEDGMQGWVSELVSFVAGLLGGATIGSLVTFKFVRSSSVHGNRTVRQSKITAGRDNIGGDRTNNG